MGIITALEAQKKNKERINVFVDGAFFCGLGLDDSVKNRLYKGMELSESDLGALMAQGEENALFNKTLVYLLKSPRTERQIRTYLFKKQAEPETAERVIGRLKKFGYIDDESYARNFSQTKQSKIGVKAIRNKLLQKGIARETADEFVAEIEDQSELALGMAEKYFNSHLKRSGVQGGNADEDEDEDGENGGRNFVAEMKIKQKLYRFLVGKGFEYDIVNAAIEKVFEHD